MAMYTAVSAPNMLAVARLQRLAPRLADLMADRAKAVQGGDLREVEAALAGQIAALQSLFTGLAERAMRCDSVPGFEVNMRMALRAQNQCRATAETLATIKNPPVIFAKQANIANGPQQVNNGVPVARAENESAPIKQKEVAHEDTQWMDTRTPRAPSRSDPALEAVAAIDRPQER